MAVDLSNAISILMVRHSDGTSGVAYIPGNGHRPILTSGFKTQDEAGDFAIKLVLRTRDDVTWEPQKGQDPT